MTPILFIHVIAGGTAVLSGFLALLTRKGSHLHRRGGNVFFVAMLVTSAAGVVTAFLIPETITVLAGVFTCYLVATSWATVRQPAGRIGFVDMGSLPVALTIGVAGIVFGLEALNSESGLKDGYTHEPYFFFAGLAFIAAAMDLRLLIVRGLNGAARIARHLWRMCLALYIATGSLFTGPGAQAFPEALRGSVILSVPENLVALLLLFWLFIALLTNRFKKSRSPS